MKICLRCKIEQPLDVFCKSARNKDGRDNYCRACKKVMNQGYVSNPDNQEKIRENKRRYWRKPEVRMRDRQYRQTEKVKAQRKARDKKTPRHIFYATLHMALKRRPTANPVTVQQLIDIWLQQSNRCAVTGLTMAWAERQGPVANSISIDRIDPEKGYSRENVRLVCHAVNAFRGRMSDAELISMAGAIVSHMRPVDDCGSSAGLLAFGA